MPAVAVVIPVRDRAAMVVEAVGSVLAQTFRDFALVVVDDGSTDGSADAAAAALAGAPAGSRVLRAPPRGVAAARNAGVAASDATWIAFLDSDDLWEPAKLAVQMAWLAARPSYRIAQTGERWLDGGRHRNPRAWHRKEEWLFPRCLERCLVSPSAVVIRRDLYDALGGFDPTFALCEDYELWLRIALREAGRARPRAARRQARRAPRPALALDVGPRPFPGGGARETARDGAPSRRTSAPP